MAQAIPFPADFTQTAIIEPNQSFAVGLGPNGFALRAFIETGSNDPHVFASLIAVSNPLIVRFLSAQTATDLSGDNGILVSLFFQGNQVLPLTCSIILLQKGAIRYQNPRVFS